MTNKTEQTTDTEVIGLFSTKESFQKTVEALLAEGFERTDLSVLASHESLDAAGSPGKPFSDVLTALAIDLKYEAPLVTSGAVWLAGGPVAATIATIIGAAVSGAAVKEALDEVTSTPHTEDFTRSVAAGSIILWVRANSATLQNTAKAILEDNGGDNVHLHSGH